MNSENYNEHERLSSGIEKSHVTPTGEVTWVTPSGSSAMPSVVNNNTKTYTGLTYKIDGLKNSITERIAENSGWDNLPFGEYNANINPRTGKVEVKAVDEASENKRFAMKLKEIIEDCLKRMPKEDWIEVNFEVKKLEENNSTTI